MKKLAIGLKNAVHGIYRMPTAQELAQKELEEAKRELLAMQTAKDYASRMVEYNSDRIKRLSTYLAKLSDQKGD
jgi:hypothetical protein